MMVSKAGSSPFAGADFQENHVELQGCTVLGPFLPHGLSDVRSMGCRFVPFRRETATAWGEALIRYKYIYIYNIQYSIFFFSYSA